MAEKSTDERNSSSIARAGKRKWGYDADQVDAFLERAHSLYDSEDGQLTVQDIQNVSFDMRKGGYQYSQVDGALDRLERAVIDKQTTSEISQHGRVAWKATTEGLYRQIATHADRQARKRFGDGTAKKPSYDRKQVDALIDKIVDKAAGSLGVDGVNADDVKNLSDIGADTISHTVFTQRKGKKGYDERQVDYFLNACSQLFSRIESYDRVADLITEPPVGPDSQDRLASGTSSNAEETQIVSVIPLFDQHAPAPSFEPSGRHYPDDQSSDSSFDALHRAEQAIFTAPVSAADGRDEYGNALKETNGTPSFAPAGSADIPQAALSAAQRHPENIGETTTNIEPQSTHTQQASSPSTSSQPPSFPAGQPSAYASGHAEKSQYSLPRQESQSRDNSAVQDMRTAHEHSASPSSSSSAMFPSHRQGVPIPGSNDAQETSSKSTFSRESAADSSLAALAHMAEISQEMPIQSATHFNPHVPSLSSFWTTDDSGSAEDSSIADQSSSAGESSSTDNRLSADASKHDSTTMSSGNAASREANQAQANVMFPAVFSDSEENDDLGIPDLSFPTFDASTSTSGDTHEDGGDADEAKLS